MYIDQSNFDSCESSSDLTNSCIRYQFIQYKIKQVTKDKIKSQ